MTRWPDEGEAAVRRRLDCRAGGEHRRSVARLRGDGVELDLRRRGPPAQELEQRRLVAAEPLLLARLAPLAEVRERLEQNAQARARLGMAEGGVQLREQRVAEDVYCALPA